MNEGSSAHLSDSVVVMRALNVIYGRCTGRTVLAVGKKQCAQHVFGAMRICSWLVSSASVVLSG